VLHTATGLRMRCDLTGMSGRRSGNCVLYGFVRGYRQRCGCGCNSFLRAAKVTQRNRQSVANAKPSPGPGTRECDDLWSTEGLSPPVSNLLQHNFASNHGGESASGDCQVGDADTRNSRQYVRILFFAFRRRLNILLAHRAHQTSAHPHADIAAPRG